MEADCVHNLPTTKDRLLQLLETNCFTDVKFVVGEKPEIINAHQLLLSAASPFFANLFNSRAARQRAHHTIKIQDFEPKILTQILKYIYADKINIECVENALQLFNAAKKFQIMRLKKACIDYLINELKPSNAFKMLKFAKLHAEKDLEDNVLKIIKRQTISVLDSKDFKNIDISIMIHILEQDQLRTTELELFQALESLALSQGVTRTTHSQFRKAVKKIQFYSMTTEQFVSGPAMSELILAEEARAITACLNKPSLLKTLYPKDFAQAVRPSKNLPHVFFDIKANGSSIGRIVIQLRPDIVPETVETFLIFCNAENSNSFKGSVFKDITDTYCKVEANGKPILIKKENFILKNREAGAVGIPFYTNSKLLSSCGSFFISLRTSDSLLDNVFVGHVVLGMNIIETIESYGSKNGTPSKEIVIENCGQINI